MAHDWKANLLHPFHNHLADGVGTVWIEVGVVLQCLQLAWIGVGRIVHQRLLRTFHTHGFKQGAGHVVKLNHRNLFTAGNRTHGIRVVAVGLTDMPLAIERTALGWRHKHDGGFTGAGLVDKLLQTHREVVPSAGTGEFLLLVVMAELHEDIVTFFHQRQDFLQAAGTDECGGGLSALAVVGYGHAVVEPAWNHLSPAGPWLIVLVHHRGVSAQENGGNGCRSRLNPDARAGWLLTAHFKGQLVVPVQLGLLALFYPDTVHHLALAAAALCAPYFSVALVHHERIGFELAFLRLDVFQHQATALGPHHRVAPLLLRTERHGHFVIAVGHVHRQEERDGALCAANLVIEALTDEW